MNKLKVCENYVASYVASTKLICEFYNLRNIFAKVITLSNIFTKVITFATGFLAADLEFVSTYKEEPNTKQTSRLRK